MQTNGNRHGLDRKEAGRRRNGKLASRVAYIAIAASAALLLWFGLGGTAVILAEDLTPTTTPVNTATGTPGTTTTPTVPADTVTPSVTATTATPSTTPETATPVATQVSVSITDTFGTPIADVEALADDEEVSGGSWQGLLSKLEAVQAAAERGNTNAAENILAAFSHQLDAFHRSGHISQDNYELLMVDYQALVEGLHSAGQGDTSFTRRGHKPDDDAEGTGGTATPAPTSTAAAVTVQGDDQTASKKDGSGQDSVMGNGHSGSSVDRGQGNGGGNKDKATDRGNKPSPGVNSNRKDK